MSRSIQRQIKRQQALADFRYRKGLENHVLRTMGEDASVADCHPDIQRMFSLVGEFIAADDFGNPFDVETATLALRSFYKKYAPPEEKPLTEATTPDKVSA